MPLFKSKKKTQAAEQDARSAHEHHENRNTAGSTAGANPNVNDYANQPGPPGQVHTINRRGGGPARAADNGKVGSPAYGNVSQANPLPLTGLTLEMILRFRPPRQTQA